MFGIINRSILIKEAKVSIVEESEFKGNKMIVIKMNEEDKYPFQFGVKKAKMVLENIDEIKKFVEKYDKASS
jgi:uncharacterized protein YgiM (DUF1202 family)